MASIRVNDREWTVAAALDTPLLYVLSNELQLQGPRFGCGLAQCGSCSVLVDGVEIRSCVTPVSRVVGKSVVTLEGLPAWYARQKGLSQPPELHPVQQAVIDEQAVQCGACYNGMIIKASELLSKVLPLPVPAAHPRPCTRRPCRPRRWQTEFRKVQGECWVEVSHQAVRRVSQVARFATVFGLARRNLSGRFEA